MKIKVGYVDYEIKKISNYTKHVEEKYGEKFEPGSEVLGELVQPEQTIYIEQNTTPEMKRVTLLHECMHDILFSIGKPELSFDEGFVESLARQIYGLYKTNDMKKIMEFVDK